MKFLKNNYETYFQITNSGKKYALILSTSLVGINGIIKSVNTLEEILLNQQMKLSTLGTWPDKLLKTKI